MIELRDVVPNAKKIYVAIYNSESSYKKKPFKSRILDPTNTVLKISMILPDGFYVASAFQDINGNEKLDFNFWGIPKEPIWLSNYDGKGAPGGFEKLKVKIFEHDQTVVINKTKF